MAYKNHFYNFICVNLKTRQQRVVGCGDTYLQLSKYFLQANDFIHQANNISRYVGGYGMGQGLPFGIRAFGLAVNQSITRSQICIRKKQTNNPHKPHYYDYRLWGPQ